MGSTSRVIHPHSPTTALTWIFNSYQSLFILPVRGLLVIVSSPFLMVGDNEVYMQVELIKIHGVEEETSDLLCGM